MLLFTQSSRSSHTDRRTDRKTEKRFQWRENLLCNAYVVSCMSAWRVRMIACCHCSRLLMSTTVTGINILNIRLTVGSNQHIHPSSFVKLATLKYGNWVPIDSRKYVKVLDENLWPVVCKNFAGRQFIFQDANQSCGPSHGQVVYRVMSRPVVAIMLGELECWVTFSPHDQRWLHVVSWCSPSQGVGLCARRPRRCERDPASGCGGSAVDISCGRPLVSMSGGRLLLIIPTEWISSTQYYLLQCCR